MLFRLFENREIEKLLKTGIKNGIGFEEFFLREL